MDRLIDEIIRDTFETRRYTGRDVLSQPVLDTMRSVPRDAFVPADSAIYAWENRPLTIGYGQTISQPFIVALMTDLLDTQPSHRILEIGTGSGYQAAVLSSLVAEVYSIEIIPELAHSAAERLAALEGIRGLWKDRQPDPIEELEEIRNGWDRDLSPLR